MTNSIAILKKDTLIVCEVCIAVYEISKDENLQTTKPINKQL